MGLPMFLEISGIKKHFGEGESRVDVLKGIDAQIEKGEICILLGPSGSGKSTLLNIIGGIDNPDSGYISINGERTADMNEKALTLDLIRPKVKKTSEKKEVVIMRVLIAVFLLISVFIAFHKNASISTLMSYSWGALAGAFLGPFMYGLFSKKVTKAAVGTSFVLGIGLTLLHMFLFGFGWFPELTKAAASLPLNMASPINAGAICMILSLIIVPLVSAFTKVKDTADVDQVFECYQK